MNLLTRKRDFKLSLSYSYVEGKLSVRMLIPPSSHLRVLVFHFSVETPKVSYDKPITRRVFIAITKTVIKVDH